MASLTLGETERIMKQYSNGNDSKFVRDRIMEYHHKQQEQQENTKKEHEISLFQNTMYLFLGITLLLFVASNVFFIDYLTILAMSFLSVSGIFLFLNAIMNIRRYKKLNGGMIKST